MTSVLVVDNELLIAMAISRILGRDGVRAIGARSVADANELLRSESIAAVVCDVHLADGTANEVLASMRRIGCNVPVVIVSGDDVVVAEVSEHPLVVEVVAKPFDIETLRRAVRRALARDVA